MSAEKFKKDLIDMGIIFTINEANDIVVEDAHVIFEYCTFRDYCETVSGNHRSYHIIKQTNYREQGFDFYIIFEDEYDNKTDIVMSRIKNLLKKYEGAKINARDCYIKEIDIKTCSSFVNKFHIQGNAGSRIKLGMFTPENQLVSIMTFGKLSRAKGNINVKEGSFELVRFCSDSEYRCIGAAGKLMKHFLRNYDWQFILTFADRRWSPSGNLYTQIGFKLHSITQANYYYLKVPEYSNRTHRFAFRRDVLRTRALTETNLSEEEILSKTEFQLATILGYDRIWDAGNFKFVIEKADYIAN